MGRALHQYSGGADRFVVVDTETTGVYNSDRVVEVALVTLSLVGEVLDTYDTLLQPRRDVSASHIHGITATMVSAAPTFEDVAGDIAVRLHGACLVAHNLPFDHRMLSNEFERLGTDLGTRVGVDTLSATGSRLTDACTTHGIPFVGAHRALTDAVATAHLFVQIADRCKPGAPLAAPSSHLRCGRVCRREDTAPVHLPDPPLVMYLASRLSHTGVEVAMLQYLEVVGRAVADVHLDREEREFLATLAGQLGLTEAQTAQSHRRFVNDLVAAAVADNEVTDEEYEALVRVASALDVDQAMVDARVHPLRSHALARGPLEWSLGR